MRGRWVLAAGLLLVLVLPGCGSGASGDGSLVCVDAADCLGLADGPCREGVCDAVTRTCAVRDAANGTGCGDAAVCYAGDCHATCTVSADCAADQLCVIRRLGQWGDAGLCVPALDVACASDGACLEVQTGPCEAAFCDGAAGHCVLDKADDGDACGEAGACYRGVCYPACGQGPEPCAANRACVEPRVGLAICVPSNAIPCGGDAECGGLVTGLCHVPRCVNGTCDPALALNGSVCAAERACWAGACVGVGPCDAERDCPQGSACVAGAGGDACVPLDVLTCAGPGDCATVVAPACHQVTCDAVDGRCHVPWGPDGVTCRVASVCLAGACVPACTDSSACDPGALCRPVDASGGGGCAEVPCASPGDCAGLLVATAPCETVTCNTLTNRCQVSPLPENASCDEGDLCNGVRRCRDGACVLASKPVECVTPPGQGCTEIVCDPASGACVAASADDGLPCDDGSPCTTGTTCSGGVCTPGQVTCTSCLYDQDCLAADDGDLCNGVPLCLDGVCVWSPSTLVHCATPDDPCLVAACDPATGACGALPAPDDTPCEPSSDLCAARHACRLGACVEVAPAVGCEPSGDLCILSACDPASGLCTSVPVVEVTVLAEAFDTAEPATMLATDAPGAVVEVSSADASSPPAALHLHAAGPGEVVFTSPELPLPSSVGLTFRARVKPGLQVGAGDSLTVSVGSDTDGWQTLLALDAAHAPASDGWISLDLALAPLSAPVRLRVHLVAAAAPGVDLWLDDLAFVRACAPPVR